MEQQPAQAAGIAAYPLEFSGSGAEFFRVWIVNVLLNVVTLGFYTPFARRRTAQYFYGHTLVAGSPLEFTAQQRKMVLGFVLLVGLYVAFKIAQQTGQDGVATIMLLGGAALAPWFWGSAMRFRLNATRWRGVRLAFTASWGEVYQASWPVFAIALVWSGTLFVSAGLVPEPARHPGGEVAQTSVWPLIVLSLGSMLLTLLCVVRLEFNYKSLLVARGRIGGQPGRWKPVFADFVRIWLATVGVFLLSVLVVILAMALLLGGSFAVLANVKQSGLVAAVLFVAAALAGIVVAFFASGPARAYREARVFRLVWSNIGVSRVARFKSRLAVGRYVALRIRNILLTLVTLGLFRPFALVSEYRMKVESVTLHVKGGLDQLAGQLAREEQGLGDAIAGAVGLDLVG